MKKALVPVLVVALTGCASVGGDGGRGPRSAAAPGSAPVDGAAECALIEKQGVDGDHKPAVDGLAALAAAGVACDPEVVTATAQSARVLAEADIWARRGLDARRRGDRAAARAAFGQALAIYPKYHWVVRLLAELDGGSGAAADEVRRRAAELRADGQIAASLELLLTLDREGSSVAPPAEMLTLRGELAELRLEEALRAQQAGDLSGAVASVRRAIEAQPADPVRGRIIDFARRLGLGLFAAGELVAARDIWRGALALDDSNELLLQYLSEVGARLRSLDQIKSGGDEPR